jgi:glycosyltransferase involved in cell wall biosynthesis
LKPRIAIVSDPLVQRGGAERLVEALAEAFPEAPIYALLYSAETGPAKLEPRIHASWLNSVPAAKSKHRMFLPLYRSAIESLDVSAFDIIISSHHTVGKAVLTRADQLHICYCHTPMRAMWERPIEELATLKQPARAIAARVLSHMRVWDVITANRAQKFIANSAATQRRIANYYRRESEIVFPPIDTDLFTLGKGAEKAGDYYLIASRPVPYKRVDIAIAATGLLGRKLKIVGGKHALLNPPAHVELLGHVSDIELRDLMRGARALLLPQLEDFGMAPLEANACGRPVVAYGAGGALDSVIDGVTGVFSEKQEVDSFAAAIRRLESTHFNSNALRMHAMRFSKERFIANMQTVVADAWKAHDKGRRPQLAPVLSLVETATS